MSDLQSISLQLKQRGMVLLVSLIIILLITVLTTSVLRSTMNNVSSTAILQRQVIAQNLLNSELIARMDILRNDKATDPEGFEIMMDALLASAEVGGGASITYPVITPGLRDQQPELINEVVVTLRGWEAASGLGMPSGEDGIPVITRNLCPIDTSHGSGCFNFVLVAQGHLVGTEDVVLQQMMGFWMPDANMNNN